MRNHFRFHKSLASKLIVLVSLYVCNANFLVAETSPLRALLIARMLSRLRQPMFILQEGIQSRANVRVDVYWTDNSTTPPIFPLYSKLNWAEEYDIVIHDEWCKY